MNKLQEMAGRTWSIYGKPTKFQIIYLSVIWAVGILLSIIVMRDLFAGGVFQKRDLLFIMLILVSTGQMIRVYRSYLAQAGKEKIQE